MKEQYLEQKRQRDSILEKACKSGDVFAVVSTATALLLVNLNTKEVILLEFNRPNYYGVSWFPNGKELVLSHSVIDCMSLSDMASYVDSEKGFLSMGSLNTVPFLSHPHQIFCASDNRVVCANTGRNAISVIDFSKLGYFQEKKISEGRWDTDHLNSVFEKNGHLYVIAHGNRQGSTLVTLTYPELKIISIQSLKDKMGFNNLGLHNIWITDEGQKICCGSETGELLELNDQYSSVLWRAGTPILTRGLAASDQIVLIGESQISKRALRHSSASALWLIDRKTWKAIDYFYLGPYGSVHEVRLLNISDEAHHGHSFSNYKKLIKEDIREALAFDKVNISLTSQENRKIADALLEDEIRIASQREVLFIKGASEIENYGASPRFENEIMRAAQKKIILSHGWSDIESWGVWSHAESATFMISSKKLPLKFTMELTYLGMVSNSYRKQSYEIFTEKGRLLQQCEFEYHAKFKKVLLKINKTEDESEEGYIVITIKMLNPISPQELGEGSDNRLLGFGLESIKILRAQSKKFSKPEKSFV